MAKAFMEVFPGLELSEDIRDLFAQTEVERVATTRNQMCIRDSRCSRLVPLQTR